VSSYRVVIVDGPNLSFDSNTEVRFDVSEFRGIGSPSDVTVYSRPVPGGDSLSSLPTSSSSGEIVAETGRFSEFVFASNSSSNPLPVELTGFDATPEEKTVRLSWQTASETNNSGFAVQHTSPTTTGWTKLGFVNSKADGGTTTAAQSYRFTTEDLSVGTHEFRLKQVDTDGSTHLSKTVTAEIGLDQPVRLTAPAPNPVQNRATLSFAVQEARRTTVRLYDALGRQVTTLYRGTPTAGESQTVALPAADLSSGVYFVRLRAGERTATRRLTVVR
jgi:hypothetical protein